MKKSAKELNDMFIATGDTKSVGYVDFGFIKFNTRRDEKYFNRIYAKAYSKFIKTKNK